MSSSYPAYLRLLAKNLRDGNHISFADVKALTEIAVYLENPPVTIYDGAAPGTPGVGKTGIDFYVAAGTPGALSADDVLNVTRLIRVARDLTLMTHGKVANMQTWANLEAAFAKFAGWR